MTDLLTLESADGARAQIHPRGAHLTQWWPAGSRDSRLFLSERAVFASGTPIRGGVPVIFPQFAGEGPLPKHGFARTAPWTLSARGDGEARFTLTDSVATRAIWDQAFLCTLGVHVGGDTLEVALSVVNTGTTALQFTAALHSYFTVTDIATTSLEGLQHIHYRDTADGGRRKQSTGERVRIAGEVDRNYFDTPANLTLHDGARRLQLHQQGFADTVVWNPGARASARFADLAADDYRRFLCIEAAQIARPVSLAPGAEWRGRQRLIAG